jgi:hypothetical protein
MRQGQVEVGIAPPHARRLNHAGRSTLVGLTPAIYFVAMRLLLTASIFLCALLTGCGVPTTADWRRCSFNVTDVAFVGFRENQTEWRIEVAAVNPNGKSLSIDGLHLHALMKGDTLATLRDPGRVDLPAGDTTVLSFDVAMPQASWSKALRTLRESGSSELLITGDVRVPTVFGSRLVKNAVHETHTVDLSAILGSMGIGGELLRGLFGR